MNALISIEELVSGYKNQPVLHGVSLAVERGQMVALIGPNGHGKTTLLRAISGLLPARAGRMRFDGEDMTHWPVHRRVGEGIIHVPQGDQLFPAMSVEENLVMGAYRNRSESQIKDGLEEVYAFFPAIASRRGQVASSLSGGERRMVGIGRGLMAQSRLLMIDEPSLGLAPRIIEQIYAGLQKLRTPDRALLLVEENPSRVIDIADRMYLLDAGKIVWEGTPTEAGEANAFLSTYLGDG